jgi:hypothetical protein
MAEVSSLRVEQGVAVPTLDNPPVNAISQAVRSTLIDGVWRAEADPAVSALVIACAGRTFPSYQANAIIAAFASEKGIEPRSFTDEETRDRRLWPMVAEAAQLLAEDVALRESDIDVVWLNGYGWPAWTGGPVFHARMTGVPEVCRRLAAMGCAPPPALRALATGEGT